MLERKVLQPIVVNDEKKHLQIVIVGYMIIPVLQSVQINQEKCIFVLIFLDINVKELKGRKGDVHGYQIWFQKIIIVIHIHLKVLVIMILCVIEGSLH